MADIEPVVDFRIVHGVLPDGDPQKLAPQLAFDCHRGILAVVPVGLGEQGGGRVENIAIRPEVAEQHIGGGRDVFGLSVDYVIEVLVEAAALVRIAELPAVFFDIYVAEVVAHGPLQVVQAVGENSVSGCRCPLLHFPGYSRPVGLWPPGQ